MFKEFNDKNYKKMRLGMEYTQIPDSDISASSELPTSPAHHARLGHPGGWCGDQDNSDPLYLQVDLTKAYIICAIATQGHFKVNMGFVEKYRLQYSEDRIAWTFYRPPSGSEVCDKLESLNKHALRVVFKDKVSSYQLLLYKSKGSNLYNQRIRNMLITINKCWN